MSKLIELQNKRNAKAAEMRALLNDSKPESRSAIDAIKAEIEGINKDIESERFLQEIENNEARKEFNKEEKRANERYDLFKAMREYAAGNLSGLEKEMHDEGVKEFSRTGGGYTDGLVVPNMILSQRADVLTTNTDKFLKSTLSDELKVANTKLILPLLGIQEYSGLNGSFEVPNMAELTAAFVAEDNASTVVDIVDSKVTMTPRFIAANQIFSKQFLAQTSPKLQNQVLAQFIFAINKGLEQEVFNQLAALTTSSATLSGATWQNMLKLQEYVPYVSAYLTSRSTMSTLKSTVKNANQGGFIAQDGKIDGIDAYASALVAAKHIYAGDFSQIATGSWDAGLVILTDPYTNKSKGKIDIQVSALKDAKVLNPAAFAKMVLA